MIDILLPRATDEAAGEITRQIELGRRYGVAAYGNPTTQTVLVQGDTPRSVIRAFFAYSQLDDIIKEPLRVEQMHDLQEFGFMAFPTPHQMWIFTPDVNGKLRCQEVPVGQFHEATAMLLGIRDGGTDVTP